MFVYINKKFQSFKVYLNFYVYIYFRSGTVDEYNSKIHDLEVISEWIDEFNTRDREAKKAKEQTSKRKKPNGGGGDIRTQAMQALVVNSEYLSSKDNLN